MIGALFIRVYGDVQAGFRVLVFLLHADAQLVNSNVYAHISIYVSSMHISACRCSWEEAADPILEQGFLGGVQGSNLLIVLLNIF